MSLAIVSCGENKTAEVTTTPADSTVVDSCNVCVDSLKVDSAQVVK